VDDQVGSFGDQLEIVVGEQRGDLDDHVPVGFESRHLQVHPGEHRVRVDACVR
jgi:hypothetical protein